jgi:hypothetical protein
MNTDTQTEMAPPVPNDGPVEATLEDELEKYWQLEELEKRFLASKRHHPKAPLPAHS